MAEVDMYWRTGETRSETETSGDVGLATTLVSIPFVELSVLETETTGVDVWD